MVICGFRIGDWKISCNTSCHIKWTAIRRTSDTSTQGQCQRFNLQLMAPAQFIRPTGPFIHRTLSDFHHLRMLEVLPLITNSTHEIRSLQLGPPAKLYQNRQEIVIFNGWTVAEQWNIQGIKIKKTPTRQWAGVSVKLLEGYGWPVN